ncbi:hypothetical protein FUAX_40170 (plasmid) [Fulvitalea axinellae]|uniref:DUF4249 domain-containing protein n=1 Tax=Fulvitalea axinellae TaxID=1182444 RepID=A0AAU9CQC6_9BACT|nr:hypothetical protein FUAX_40170 [Fulvitalea axinellae]
MISVKRYILGLISILALASCEKVIDVELDSSDPRVVIEGVVTDIENGSYVTVKKTVDFENVGKPELIKNAKVTLSSGGQTWTFESDQDGVYRHDGFTGQIGSKYTLKVEEGGVTHTASATMLQRIPIEKITMEFDEDSNRRGDDDDNWKVKVKYFDPAGPINYYKFAVWVDGELVEDRIMIRSGKYSDGINTEYSFWEDLAEGQKLRVHLYQIEEKTYEYFESISDIYGGGNPLAPGNPDGQFDTDALGYFATYPVSEKSVTVTDTENRE